MAKGISTVSRRAGVSVSTVSHILSGRGERYSSKTRENVLRTAKEVGYSPNRAARALATGRTDRIAFWQPFPGGRFFHEVEDRFHALLRKDSYELSVREVGPKMVDPSNAGGLTRAEVDGVLLFGSGLGEIKPILENNMEILAPIVNMGVAYDGPLDFVEIEDYSASRQAVEHLIDSGRTRIAHFLCGLTEHPVYGRYRAYKDVLREAGWETEFIRSPDQFRPSARRIICDYVKQHGCPDAIFFSNDELVIGGYRGLRDLGMRIPEDVYLIGVDGIDDLEYLDPPISSVAQPLDDMCRVAWEFLSRRMEDPDLPQQRTKLEAQLVIRS